MPFYLSVHGALSCSSSVSYFQTCYVSPDSWATSPPNTVPRACFHLNILAVFLHLSCSHHLLLLPQVLRSQTFALNEELGAADGCRMDVSIVVLGSYSQYQLVTAPCVVVFPSRLRHDASAS